MADKLLTVFQLANKVQTSPQTIYGWRHRGIGPKGLRMNGRVRYRESDVDAWLEAQADGGAAA